MIQLLSLAMFATVMVVAIMAIISTVKAELPYIARALGADGVVLPPRQSTREPRARVTRPLRTMMPLRQMARPSPRAAA